jgi:hypothetical protein
LERYSQVAARAGQRLAISASDFRSWIDQSDEIAQWLPQKLAVAWLKDGERAEITD